MLACCSLNSLAKSLAQTKPKSFSARQASKITSKGKDARHQSPKKAPAGSLSRAKTIAAKTPVIESAPKPLVLALYRDLLRQSKQFQFTDPNFFARRMHQEFIKRRDVKDNNLYYIRGKWMLENSMGGLL